MNTLVRLHLRRDRWLLLVWIAIMAGVPAALSSAAESGYPTQQAIDDFVAASRNNPAEIAIRGPIFASSRPGLVAWNTGSVILVVAAVAILLMVRYGRADEQDGRQEIVRSQPVTRREVFWAGAVVTVTGAAVGCVLCFAALVAAGSPATGSAVLAATIFATTLLFAALGGLGGQIARSAGAARGVGLGLLGLFYGLAAAGDLSKTALVWFTPIGWARHAEAFAGDRGWLPAVALLSAAIVFAAVDRIVAGRDYTAGLLPTRQGLTHGRQWLSGPTTLVWRTQRSTLITWTVVMVVLGALIGSAMTTLAEQVDNDTFRGFAERHGSTDVAGVFFLLVLFLLAQIATMAALSVVLRLRSDEASAIVEPILAQPVTRLAWARAQFGLAALQLFTTMTALTLGAGITSGRWDSSLSALAYIPSGLVVIAIAAALYGWAPRAAVAVSWTLMAALLLLDMLGEFGLITADAWRNFSPFAATLSAVFQSGLALPISILVGVAAIGTGFAAYGLKRRDLALG